MPVFYLLLVVLAMVAGIGSFARQPETVAPVVSTPATFSRPVPVLSRIDEAVPPDDGILRTSEGLRRKVLVKDLDLVCRTEAQGGLRTGPPLDYFSIHYVFGETPAGPEKMYQIGPRDGPPRGWVPAASVLEWNTRLMARPTPREGRPSLVIYREESCLLDALAGRTCPKHGDHCPIEGEESDDSRPGDSPAAGLPILKSRSIPQPDGSERTVFEVASLVQDEAPTPLPDKPPPDLLPALRRVYVAFVIDTTKSMQPSIDAARAMAERLVAEASRRYQEITLRLALVEYRDSSPKYGFRTRIVTSFTDPAGFLEALRRIKAAREGDGSIAERVLDGVAVALPAPEGEPLGATAHLDWPTGRSGELATKMLVLLGDAPDHDQDQDRVLRLADLAKAEGITVASVAIDRAIRSRDEEQRYRDQWRILAEGSYRPRDRAANFQTPISPILLSLNRAEELVPLLENLIADRVEHARNLAALATAEAEQRLEQYVNSQGLTLAQVHPVLVDLHRNEPTPVRRPDPRFGGRKAPSVRKGWIAERREEHRLVVVSILMSRAELDALIQELTELQQAAQGTSRDLEALLRIGTAAASGETEFLAADRGSQTFADHLRRRQGLPPARPDSLLRRTQVDLLQADETYRAALEARLSAAIEQLVRRRNDADWNDGTRLLDGMALVPYEPIDF